MLGMAFAVLPLLSEAMPQAVAAIMETSAPRSEAATAPNDIVASSFKAVAGQVPPLPSTAKPLVSPSPMISIRLVGVELGCKKRPALLIVKPWKMAVP